MIQKYIDRLLNEWKQHKKIVIACDFDDTISPWRLDDPQTFSRVKSLLKRCKEAGAYIVIWTASETKRYPLIEQFCKDNELEIEGININVLDLVWGNNAKIYANIFIDDRAGLNESLTILESALNAYNLYLNERN